METTATPKETSTMIDIIVSAGHAEYMIDICARPSLTVQVVWDPMADIVIDDTKRNVGDLATEGTTDDAIWAIVTGLSADRRPAGVDLTWETVIQIVGERDEIVVALEGLVDNLGDEIGGDDTVFDYWPSGVRFARAIASALGNHYVAQVDEVAREQLATIDASYRDEVADKAGMGGDLATFADYLVASFNEDVMGDTPIASAEGGPTVGTVIVGAYDRRYRLTIVDTATDVVLYNPTTYGRTERLNRLQSGEEALTTADVGVLWAEFVGGSNDAGVAPTLVDFGNWLAGNAPFELPAEVAW